MILLKWSCGCIKDYTYIYKSCKNENTCKRYLPDQQVELSELEKALYEAS